MRAALSSLACAALLAGCGPSEELEDAVCPEESTELTYESFGRAFIDRYCQYCHASWVEDRRGAPFEYTFDDRESVAHHAEHIYARSAGDNTSMPPGPDDPPVEERDALAEWLACGAP